VTSEHIETDKKKLAGKLGTTSKGIAPAYSDKYARIGIQFKEVAALDSFWKNHLFDGRLYGNVLCEGAQGFFLDINWGNYPYITSSETLPYAACSLGFSPKKIKNIYAVAKLYDTRSGEDPDFPEALLDNPELLSIADAGQEYGTTTGRRRKVNYLNLDRLIFALNTAGGNHLIVSKCDILEIVNIYKLFYKNELMTFKSLDLMKEFITARLSVECPELEGIYYSSSTDVVEGLTI
jgi:adenylosuccinate synthase